MEIRSFVLISTFVISSKEFNTIFELPIAPAPPKILSNFISWDWSLLVKIVQVLFNLFSSILKTDVFLYKLFC